MLHSIVDLNGDGYFTRDELKSKIDVVKNAYWSQRAKVYMKTSQVDRDQDGLVTLGELFAKIDPGNMMKHELREKSRTEETRKFHLCDLDGDGKLNLEEMSLFLQPEPQGEADLDVGITDIMEKVDADKSGHVSLVELSENHQKLRSSLGHELITNMLSHDEYLTVWGASRDEL